MRALRPEFETHFELLRFEAERYALSFFLDQQPKDIDLATRNLRSKMLWHLARINRPEILPLYRNLNLPPYRGEGAELLITKPPTYTHPAIPYNLYFSHCHVVAPTGMGKSQLISTMVANLIPTNASIVVIDSQGDLINSIKKIEAIQDRLIYISPREVNPQINVLDVRNAADAIQTLTYFFSDVANVEMTGKQGVCFRYVIRLMLTLPQSMGRTATMADVLEFLNNPIPYQKAIDALSPAQRSFFENDYKGKDFRTTRSEIRYRIMSVLENPALESLFASSRTKLDLGSALDRGSIILIDTAEDYLRDACGVYGRVFITLILHALIERTGKYRHPVHLFIDEVHQYFSSQISDMMVEVRKRRCSMVLAHQFMGQASQQLQAALKSQPAIRAVNALSLTDARALAPEMKCDPEDLTSTKPLQFEVYARGMYSPETMKIEYGALDQFEKVTDNEWEKFLVKNAARLTAPERRVEVILEEPDPLKPSRRK